MCLNFIPVVLLQVLYLPCSYSCKCTTICVLNGECRIIFIARDWRILISNTGYKRTPSVRYTQMYSICNGEHIYITIDRKNIDILYSSC